MKDYKFLQPLQNKNLGLTLLPEYHEDYVDEIPEGFRLLGRSNSCKVEAMVS